VREVVINTVCRLCHEPMEECLPMDVADQGGLTASEREQHRPPPPRGLICFECKLEMRGVPERDPEEEMTPERLQSMRDLYDDLQEAAWRKAERREFYE